MYTQWFLLWQLSYLNCETVRVEFHERQCKSKKCYIFAIWLCPLVYVMPEWTLLGIKTPCCPIQRREIVQPYFDGRHEWLKILIEFSNIRTCIMSPGRWPLKQCTIIRCPANSFYSENWIMCVNHRSKSVTEAWLAKVIVWITWDCVSF